MAWPRVRSSQPPAARDVFDPVRVRAIGQGDDVAVAGAEHIDRCLVAAPGAAATVNDHAEARHPGCDMPGEVVQPGLVPLPDHFGYRHTSSCLASGSQLLARPAFPSPAGSYSTQAPPGPIPGRAEAREAGPAVAQRRGLTSPVSRPE